MNRVPLFHASPSITGTRATPQLIRLGPGQFWLLSGIAGGLLALVLFILTLMGL